MYPICYSYFLMITLIFDLDNTIYSVSSIRDQLFPPLFDLLGKPEYGLEEQRRQEAQQEIMRKPFQKVANDFNFPGKLIEESLDLLRNMTFTGSIEPSADYQQIRKIPAQRFLVTTGFYKLQKSKIVQMQIEDDFKEIYIIDPDNTAKTKKDAFEELIQKHALNREETVVVGDDPESEIRAAHELGLKSFLLNSSRRPHPATYQSDRLIRLVDFLAAEGLLEADGSENLKSY